MKTVKGLVEGCFSDIQMQDGKAGTKKRLHYTQGRTRPTAMGSRGRKRRQETQSGNMLEEKPAVHTSNQKQSHSNSCGQLRRELRTRELRTLWNRCMQLRSSRELRTLWSSCGHSTDTKDQTLGQIRVTR